MSRYLNKIFVTFLIPISGHDYSLFQYFDNSLFLAVIRLYSQCQNVFFSYVRMKKSQLQVGKYQGQNHRFVE